MICDNLSAHKAPAVHRWLLAHPRVQLHFTPAYSSWISQVERWFAELQRRCLDRGVFCSLDELATALEERIKIWNASARPDEAGEGVGDQHHSGREQATAVQHPHPVAEGVDDLGRDRITRRPAGQIDAREVRLDGQRPVHGGDLALLGRSREGQPAAPCAGSRPATGGSRAPAQRRGLLVNGDIAKE